MTETKNADLTADFEGLKRRALFRTKFCLPHILMLRDKARVSWAVPKSFQQKGVIPLAEEINGQMCILYDDPTPLPADPVPAMAYVPYQQWSNQLHSAERAFDAGTLFPVLDKPFLGRKGEPR